ncbi:autotransporter outer membrane beta-barrel domain-containing protein [Yersinia mollaretii]|uniref:autotransporter outer membrane beta-barrel domain-containing protein n=1 Tax=Yersinia mollaretii TaxID=33060 RepID=UPI0011A618BA|nr:autotransporter outer membrane beta-barrel domain-containing protein [Yersinia mollaretii]
MNEIFKVIWNASLNIWVAVGEFAKGKLKSKTTRRISHSQSSSDLSSSLLSVRISLLAAALMGVFGAQPAFAISVADCAAMAGSCVTVSTAAGLATALSGAGAGSTATTILLTANIDLSAAYVGGITVNQATNARQNLVIDGGGYDLKFAGYAFNMLAGTTNNAAWSQQNATFLLTNFNDITSTLPTTSGNISRLVYVQDATTRLDVTLDNINSVPNGKLVAMGSDSAAVTPNSVGRVIFGNITQPITLNFGTYRQAVLGSNISFTGTFNLTGIYNPNYPAVFWSNDTAANSVLHFANGADVNITGTRLTNGPFDFGVGVASYNYLIDDGAKLSLTIDGQNPLGLANYGVQIGSYNTATGLFGAGAVINMNNLAGDVISNASSTTSTSYIYNGPASNNDVVYNLAAGSNLVVAAGAANDGINASKTTGTGGIYIRSAATISDGTLDTTAGTGINVSGSTGNVVVRNEAQGTIRKATGISVTSAGSGAVNITNAGTINSTSAGISVSSTPAKTISVNNTGGTINASGGTGINVLSNAVLDLVGGTITTTGAASGLTFAGASGNHTLADVILNLNGSGAAFTKNAGVNLLLNHVTFNTVAGTALNSLAGLTFANSVNGHNIINVTGAGIGVTSAGGVDLSSAYLDINVTNSAGIGLQVADGTPTTTTIGANSLINATGATAISFTGTTAKTLTNNGTINGAVTFAGAAANIINNNAILNGTLTTGSGNDSLVLGSDSESNGAINLGDGNNNVTIENGAQVSSITTGIGDDIFTINGMAAGSTYLGSLNAGSGNNSLNFNNSYDALRATDSLQGFANINLTSSQIELSSKDNVGSGTINIDSSSDLLFGSTFNGILNASLGHVAAGDGLATVEGGANVILSQASAFAGDWQINQNGTLTASSSDQLGTSNLALDGTLNLNGMTTFNNSLMGAGSLNIDTANHVFNFGVDTGTAFAGTVDLKNSFFTLYGNNADVLRNASLVASAGSGVGVADSSAAVAHFILNGGDVGFEDGSLLTAGTLAVTSASSIRVDTAITTGGNLLDQDDGNSVKLIDSTNTLSDAQLAQLTLREIFGASLGADTEIDVVQGGNAVAQAIYDFALSGAGSGLSLTSILTQLALTSGQSLTLTSAGAVNSDNTLLAQLTGAGNLIIGAGNGVMTLNNATNNYTGSTSVNGGILNLGSDNALGATSTLSTLAATETHLNGHTQTVGTLTNAGIVNLGGGTLTLTSGGTSTATGGLTGAGSLNINGGDLEVTGANSGLSGQTLIASGASATLSGAGTLGSSAINVLGDLNLNGANSAFSNVLSGTGDINTNAAVTLTGTNSFSGAHHIGAAGALTVTEASNLGASTATVNLDSATSHLVLSGLSGAIANALSGVANSTVDINNGANVSLTGDNSGFSGQYALADSSKLTVASSNNLGAAATIALAGAQDILALSGFSGTFANTVTGSGVLQVTDSSDVTLTNTNGVGSDVTVDITNATLNLDAIALFANALTGSGLLNIDAATNTFNFASTTGTAFTGTVDMQNSIFTLNSMNSGVLSNASLIASAGAEVFVDSSHQTIGNFTLNGGTAAFGTGSLITTGTLGVTSNSSIRVDPALTTGGNLLDQNSGITVQLIDSSNTLTAEQLARLTLLDITGNSLGSGASKDIVQGGNTVAQALYNYALSGVGGGLNLTTMLTQLELLLGQSLTLTSAGTLNPAGTLLAQLTGEGNLIIGTDNSELTLSNATNDYTGSTSVNGGILNLGSNNALGATSVLNTAATTQTNLNGHSQTVGALTNAGTVTLGSGGALTSTGAMTNSNILNLADGTLTLNAGGTSTATGGLTGAGSLNINGGDLEVTGANSGLSGQTLIASGASATLSGAGTLGSSAINVLGDLNLAGANSAFSNVLSGSGDINTTAAVTLTGTNSFSGAHNIGTDGALTITQASNLGASTATVNLDSATSHLVLNGLSGAIANALSGVADSTVDINNGANVSLTGNNSGFSGQYALADSSKLTVASTNNLGAAATVALAGAQDILALSGFSGTFANTVTGDGVLQVTDSSDVTLTNTNGVDSDVTVDITNATLNLADIALFDHALTGSGTLNVAKNDASTAFDFGSSVGGAFSGTVNLSNSTFALSADNSAALASATLKLSANNVTTVGTDDRTLHNVDLSGGTLIFDGAAPQSQARGVLTVDDLALNSGTISVTGTDSWTNQNPVTAPNLSILDQDRGDIMLTLINASSVSGNANDLDLMINGTSVTSGSQGVSSSILQGGTAVANATHNYGLTSSNGSGGNGLYVNYSLSALELLTDGADALLLATDSSATSNKVLNALVSGVGGLQVDATNGALTLANGNNSYQGATTVNAGELILGADGAFGATSLLDVASGATANINGHSQTVGALTNAGTVTLGSGGALTSTGAMTNSNSLNLAGGTLTLNAGGTSTATGGLTGAGSLNINGGDLEVTGANSGLSGQTLIASGASATLSGVGTLGSSAINVLGDLNLAGANSAFSNVLSGTGDINTTAAITLTGSNSFSGAHNIGTDGALTITQASNLGASTATVNLNTATSHLVLNGLSGAIANALSGVANSTVDINNGANVSLTGDNSGFSGQYALADSSKLTVASTNNLGAAATVALAGAQDILALSGFSGTFANTVTGSGVLQVTDSSDVTLTTTNGVGSDVTVDITNASLNLADIALFDHALTGSGTLNVAKNDASTAFDFGSTVGSAFSGTVNLQNSTFNIGGLNTSALTNSTLKLSSGSLASVADGVQNIGGLALNGGTLLLNNLVDNSGVISSLGTLAANSIDTTGGGNVRVNLPANVTPDLGGLSVMQLDEGEIIVTLATGAATGTGHELTLSDELGDPLSATVYQSITNPGALSPAALGSFNYGLTTGTAFDGLYVNYGLNAVELQATGNDALILTATLANNGLQSNDLSAQVTGSGDLAFVSANDGSIASLSNSTNSYTGATWVRSGNVRLEADSALGQTSQLAMSTATRVDLNGTQQTVGQLFSETGSTLDFNSGKLTVTNGGQVDGALTGSGELDLTSGLLSITESNSGFTGSTDIASGATAHLYQVQGLGSGAINNNGLLNLDSSSGALLNALAGSGNVQLTNSANVQLAADNSGYSGLFTTDAGTVLTANSAANLGSSSVANSGELILDTASLWDLTNSISGSGTLVKRGSGTVKIDSGTVSASLTTIEDGLLQLGSSPAISTLTVNESPLARSLVATLASNAVNLVSDVLITSTGSLGGYGQVTGNVENRGNLIMPNALTGGAFGTFTIDGNYTGDNGTVVFNTVLAGDSSITDRLLITGNTAGQSFVTVNNIGGNGARTAEGIKIIDVGGDSAGQFTLNGRAVAGAYEYFLYQGGVSSPTDGDWYLRTQADERRPEPASYTANLAAANTLFVSSLADRSGETLYTDLFTGEVKSTSLWLRNQGSHNRSRDDSGELKTQDNRYVMQLGGDVAQWSRNNQDLWRVGVMAGYGNSSSSTVAQGTGYRSTGSVDGYSVGMYGTWFEQGQEQTGAYVDSWLQYSWFNNQVSGEGLETEKYDSKGFTASVEGGYAFNVGQSANQNYFIQPKAQVVWMGVKADSHTETNGTVVTGEGNNNIQTRLGVKAFISPIPTAEKANVPAFKPYVEANWIHNTKDFGTTLDGMTVKQAGAANVAELKVGVEGQVNKQLNLWGNVGQQVGNNGYSDSSITLGVKYNF